MRVFLTSYDVRKIYVASQVGKESIFIKNYEKDRKLQVKIYNDRILVENKEIPLKDILWLLNSRSVVMVDDKDIYDLTLYSNTGKFYRIVCCGDLDMFNLDVSGSLLYSKNMPIKDIINKIYDECKDFNKILVFGSKLGYYSIELSKNANVLTVEEDKNILEIMKYNPFSREFFDNKLPFRIDSIYNIERLGSFDCVIYCPPPYSNSSRYYYSSPVLKRLKRICKKKLLLDIERPMKGNFSKVIINLRSKLENLGYTVKVDEEYGLIISE